MSDRDCRSSDRVDDLARGHLQVDPVQGGGVVWPEGHRDPLQHQLGADVLAKPPRLHQHLSQSRHIFQAQIQPLAGDGMDAVR